MIKAEAWLQCSARGTTVTRLAYIGGFHPSCAKGQRHADGGREFEQTREKRPQHTGSFSL